MEMTRELTPREKRLLGVLGAVVVVVAAFFGHDPVGLFGLRHIEQQVAADAVKQYHIAKAHGTAIDACVAAGLVSAAYLQAKDEENYAAWRTTERAECARAGLPDL